MSKRIECTSCDGIGKKLVKRAGVIKVVRCKECGGKGKLVVKKEKTSKAAKLAKIEAIEKAEREEAKEARSNGVMVFSRELGTTNETKTKKLTEEQREARDIIEERAAFFQCPGKVSAIRKGPVITLYEFTPAKVTRIKRLQNLSEDLALALSAEAVMVRRIPGKDVMGIEISNDAAERQNVGFRASLEFVVKARKAGMSLPLNLGTDPFGDPVIDDLATMPHLLIAGSTGAGKSVSLNCIISSLISTCTPDELQFYMIDPKGVELTHYNGIPHMRQPMVTSPHYAKQMLESLVLEMRRRLEILTHYKVRDLGELNAKRASEGRTLMPRIVLVVDELGDLMLQDKKAFTQLFAEISQIARATGIHMICATQRPSVDVLPGKVKVNFPGRMAFKVTSRVDSNTIVHRKGAEGLLGRGDMLYLSPTRATAIRIHAPWVPLEDVKTIANTLREFEQKRREEEQRAREKAEEEKRKREAEEQRKREQGSYGERKTVAPAEPAPRMLPQGQKETIPLEISWLNPTKK